MLSVGSVNINLMHPQSCAFADNLNASVFYPLITKPIRITATNRTRFDNILTNSVDDPGISGVLLADLSDHLHLFYLAYAVIPFKNGKPVASCRNFCQSNIEKFILSLYEITWHSVEMEGDAQKAYDIFLQLFSKLFEIAFPHQNTKMCPKNPHLGSLRG